MRDMERSLRDLGERVREEQGPSELGPQTIRAAKRRRLGTIVTSLVVVAALAYGGTFVAGALGTVAGPIPPAGGDLYSADVPAEVWVVSEKGLGADPGLNLAWGRDSERVKTLACVAGLPFETSRVELVHDRSGDVLSWGDNFTARDDFAAVCAHNLDAEVLVAIANDPSAHSLVIDGERMVHLVRTEAVPMAERREDCNPAIGFEPTYLPKDWVPELQEGAASGEDPYDNIAGHYGAEGPPGDHRKMDSGFVDLVAFGFRFEPPTEADLIVLGQPAEFDEENGTIEFGFEGCAYALVGAGVGRDELVPFAEGLVASPISGQRRDEEGGEHFAAMWPEDTAQEASDVCNEAQANESWRTDAVRTAEEFGRQMLGWEPVTVVRHDEGRRVDVELRRSSQDEGAEAASPAVIVYMTEVFENCWSVGSVSGLPDRQPTGISISIRGKGVEIGFDDLGADSIYFEIGHGSYMNSSDPEAPDGRITAWLTYKPDQAGHFLLLFKDENGEVFSAAGGPLPAGDFAAG